jgi:hypothetical protein
MDATLPNPRKDPEYLCFRLDRLRNTTPEQRLRVWKRVLRETNSKNDGSGYYIINGILVETNWYAFVPCASKQTVIRHLRDVGIKLCD